MTMDLEFFQSETSHALRAEGVHDCIIRALSQRNIEVPGEVATQIRDCTDRDQLDRWFDRSLTANTVGDLFVD